MLLEVAQQMICKIGFVCFDEVYAIDTDMGHNALATLLILILSG